MKYLTRFDLEQDYLDYIDGGDAFLPNVSTIEETSEVKYVPEPPPHDYSQDYLTLEILSPGVINWKLTGPDSFAKTIQYSKISGEWISIVAASTPTTISVVAGDKIRFKGTNATYGNNLRHVCSFAGSTASFNAVGNIMSLIAGDNFENTTTFSETCVFENLFSSCPIVSAKNLILPATTLTEMCYMSMFASSTSLVEAPALPASILISSCYFNMFNGCTNLNYIKCLATSISDEWCVKGWVSGVAASGTFVKAASMSSWTTGADGIPSGWTIVDI